MAKHHNEWLAVQPTNSVPISIWVIPVKHTYPMTAMRMLAEIGRIREGICIEEALAALRPSGV